MNNNDINIKSLHSKGFEGVVLPQVTTNEQGQQVISGRELYEALKIKKDFTPWMKTQLELVVAVESEDYSVSWYTNDDSFKEVVRFNGSVNSMTRKGYQQDYALTINIAKEICMVVGAAPRTNEETRQLSKQVRKYFIECEKALHNPYANMSKELQAIFAIDHKQQEIDRRLTTLENNMTIDYSQQETLRLAVSTRVYELLGSAKDNEKLRSKLYSSLHRCIKREFSVNSYKNIAVKDFEKARTMITTWMPDEVMMLAIQGAKSQMSLM